MKKRYSAILAFLVTLVSVGFGQDYFPLRQGSSWEYSFDLARGTQQKSSTMVKKVLPAMTIKGQQVIPIQYQTGQMTFYNITRDAVLWMGGQGTSDLEPTIFDVSLLALPRKPTLGYGWELPQESWLQAGKKVFCGISIDKVDETVVLPSGVFEHCVRIKISGENERTSIVGYDWYAPNIGYIKGIYEEVYKVSPYKFDWITLKYVTQLTKYTK